MNLTFTFQSGYIQILFPIYWHYLLYFLYIPIWLYSNPREIFFELIGNNFTFQSGYIQIRENVNALEFHISLHSNLVIFKCYLPVASIRLVLALHSNLVIFKCS